MDLRRYYEAIQRIEEQIAGQDVLVVSEATADGGRPGVISEVTRNAGARLVVEGKARFATAEEQASFRQHRQKEPMAPSAPQPPTAAATTVTKRSVVRRARKG
jgi:hypothetical protein